MTPEAAFWNKAATKYAASPVSDQAAYEFTLARSQSYLQKTHAVLELGCGTGSTALELAGGVESYVGTDISEEMIGFARAKAQERGIEGLSFQISSVDAALAQSHPVDVVCAFSLLHLVRDLDGTLARSHDLLPTGGLLISKTPCLGSMRFAMRLAIKLALPAMRAIGKAPFVHTLTTAQLEAQIERAGFDIVETVPSPKGAHHYVVARKL